MRLVPTILVAVMLTAPVTTVRAADPEFGAHWHDGRAELSGYRLSVQRYGHRRAGRGVTIYVTEPFSRSRHVKLDDPARTPADAVEVLKLILVRDFQTGIYDYHTALSLFSTSSDFAPLKLSFTSSEWCGQVHEQLDVTGGSLEQRIDSYFEGESAQRTIPIPAGGIQEDQLFVLLRGLRGPWLDPGAQREVPFLASPFYRRLAHRQASWTRATIRRLATPATVRVPAGSIVCDVYEVRPGDGRSGRFDIERAYPHRVVRWAWTAETGARSLGGTDVGELTGTKRLAYWKSNAPGDEVLLRDLGLEPAVP